MLWITLTATRFLIPARVFLGVGDTVEIPAVVIEKGERRKVQPDCSLVMGESVKVAKNRLIGLKPGKSLVACKYRGKKRATVVIVAERDRESFRPPKRVIVLRVGERVPLPRPNVPEGYSVKWLVKPKWLARIVGDSVEGLSEGRGIIQVHVVKGNEVVREYPIRLIVIEEDTDLRLHPRFVRLKVGDAVKFRIKGNYDGRPEWFVLNDRVGRIEEDGTFIALHPGRTIVLVRVKGKDGKVLSARALVVVRPRKNPLHGDRPPKRKRP